MCINIYTVHICMYIQCGEGGIFLMTKVLQCASYFCRANPCSWGLKLLWPALATLEDGGKYHNVCRDLARKEFRQHIDIVKYTHIHTYIHIYIGKQSRPFTLITPRPVYCAIGVYAPKKRLLSQACAVFWGLKLRKAFRSERHPQPRTSLNPKPETLNPKCERIFDSGCKVQDATGFEKPPTLSSSFVLDWRSEGFIFLYGCKRLFSDWVIC